MLILILLEFIIHIVNIIIVIFFGLIFIGYTDVFTIFCESYAYLNFYLVVWLYKLNSILFVGIILILLENYINNLYLDYLKEDYIILMNINKLIKYLIFINYLFYII